MRHFSVFIKYFAIISIVISLLVNFGLCLNESNFQCLISFRNVFLYLLLLCFVVHNKFTLVLLVLLNTLFWLQFFQLESNITYFNNPILYFNQNLYRILNLANCNESVLKTVIIIPFVLNLFFLFIEIPYRILVIFSERNKSY